MPERYSATSSYRIMTAVYKVITYKFITIIILCMYTLLDSVIFTQPNLRLDGKPFNLRTSSSFRPAALH